jgi:Fic family protein
MSEEQDRHSKALEAELISDPDEKARREARNGLRQFDEVVTQVEHWLGTGRPFKLRPSAILGLHRVALDGISLYAGIYRPAGIAIKGSAHQPPGAHLVPELVENLCDYVNENWNQSPIHLAAFTLWRMNWIHPFVDGNGRTARSTSYLVLCLRLGSRLPGSNTIPEQISQDKKPYYEALEAADRACSEGKTDVAQMEGLLEGLLANQLVSILRAATTGGSQGTEGLIAPSAPNTKDPNG